MVIDQLNNAPKYYGLGTLIEKALRFLQDTDLSTLENGKHELAGDALFAIVQEYDTKDPLQEKMEAHKKYIDVQFVVSGTEKMGHALLEKQTPSRAYNPDDDYMLFDEHPSFFSVVNEGMFTIFFPTDLHMPCIRNENSSHVKKIVLKVLADHN